jgi:hypothetical protein
VISLVFPSLARAANNIGDIGPPAFVVPGLFVMILLLALPISFLGPGHARTRRSLALLIALVATFGAMTQLLPLPLNPWVHLALFLGIFGVIYLMGRFDAPE